MANENTKVCRYAPRSFTPRPSKNKINALFVNRRNHD